MAHVAIIGAGLGGVPCAFELRRRLGRAHRMTLIGASPHFEFTPSNPWIAVGWRTRDQTRVALAGTLAAKGIEWHSEPVARIDAEGKRLLLQSGQTSAYDFLVIATGPKLAFEEVPGLGPSGFTQSVCTQEHAAHAFENYRTFIEHPGRSSSAPRPARAASAPRTNSQ
jgi:sulfide:quinone oxidoreductase